MLALATAAYMTAVITCSSSYLWHQPPPQLQLHNTWLDWQSLQQAVAASNLRPAQVWLQQHPANTRANFASLQQSLASFAALIDAAQRGLADPQCILQQLPPFEDATECWLLHGQSAAAAAAQRMCIHTLRRRISEASLSPFQLMCHADEPHLLVWVMDLVLLRLVDAAYGEMQEQEQEQAAAADAYQHQQQQQQQAGVMQRQHSGAQQQQQQLQLSRSSSHPPGLQQRVQQQSLQSPRVLSPGKSLQQQHQQQQQLGKHGEAIPAEAPLTPSPIGEPASSTPADAAAAAAAAGPSPNHVPRSIVASAFPAQVAARFVWPGVRVRSRIVLRRSFVGCEEALYITDEEDSELLSESEDEGWDRAAAAAGAEQQRQQQQQGEEAAAGKLQPAEEELQQQQDQQQSAAVIPAVDTQEQQAPQQQQQKAKGGRPRKRKGESAAVLESCLAELDPATAAAAKEAMYGIRRSTRGDAAVAAPPAVDGSAAGVDASAAAAAAEVQMKPRKRRASQRSTPDSAAEVAAAAAAATATGRQQRSRSATPAAESSPAAAGDAMQEQLQALAADEDMDDDTRAAIQAAMFGLRGSKHHKEQQQQQQQVSGQRASSAKRPAAAAAAGANSSSSKAANRPAKRSRKAAAAAAAAGGPGCGRAMDLPQMRQAAAVTKLPGFCKGLTQALQARKRRSNAADASAGLLQDNGYLMPVPYALPACLLTLDGGPAASGRTSSAGGHSAAGLGGLTGHQTGSSGSSSAAGGSRGQRSQLRAMVKGEAGSNLSEAAKWKNLVARSKKVVFERSGVHGWGLFAGEEIAADEFIIQYVGELIRPALSDTRERMYEAAGQDSSYLFRLDRQRAGF
jgi:hypothetical protein